VQNLQDSLQMASEERNELKQSVLTLKEEWAQFKSELQMASKEREELKQSVLVLEKEKSDLLIDHSNLKEECARLKSELSDVKKYCESSIAKSIKKPQWLI
jgi:chromosome segregation ATPase